MTFREYGDPYGKPLFFFHGWPEQLRNLADGLGIGRFAALGVSGGGP